MLNYIIRRALPKDAEGILKLLRDIAELHYKGRPDIFRTGSVKYTSEQLVKMINENTITIFVAADENDEVVGYVFCFIKETLQHKAFCDRRYLYIDDICINEALRGRGIGKSLMEEAERQAKSAGCKSIELNVWNLNEGARRFYEKLGMTVQRSEMEKKL